jgi:hypothetical protein
VDNEVYEFVIKLVGVDRFFKGPGGFRSGFGCSEHFYLVDLVKFKVDSCEFFGEFIQLKVKLKDNGLVSDNNRSFIGRLFDVGAGLIV